MPESMPCGESSLQWLSAHGNFLKGTAIQAAPIFQMKRDSSGIPAHRDLGFKRHKFGRINISYRNILQLPAVLIVEVSDKPSRKKYSKRTGECDFAVLRTRGPKR